MRRGKAPARQTASRPEGKSGRQAEMSQYIFTFELLRQYPNLRAYIMKQPLQKSFKDQIGELLGGKKR
jgi:hypothetical protein